MKREMQDVLQQNILPFWMERMVDRENGGFYGRIDGQGRLHPQAEKGAILNARILWAFAAAYRVMDDGTYRSHESYLTMATRAKDYLVEHFIDKEYGGVYWSVDYQGRPLDTKKQFYAIGFAIYGLSEYVRATGDREALDYALKLYDSIEELSTRLMKLESENSLLQLMINSSVYDLSTITDPDYPYIVKLREESPKNYRHCMKVAQISADAAELIKCDSEEAYAIGMYLRAPKVLGDEASAVLSKTYRIPKSIIKSVYKINDKANVTVMSREAGIVMLTDDIIYSYNYLRSKTKEDVSIERIVNNAIKVRKDQNCLRSAGFTNEEIQLLRLYYNDLGDQYDTAGTD